MTSNKIDIFEYIIFKLCKWYEDENNDFENNDLSLLKVFKLHFLVCAINSKNDPTLLDIFDNFHALPYGPVESDIYDSLTNLKYFELTRNCCSPMVDEEEMSFEFINSSIKESIDISIKILRIKDKKMILLPAGILVDYTHEWDSWKKAYRRGLKLGRFSYQMDQQDIINDVIKINSYILA